MVKSIYFSNDNLETEIISDYNNLLTSYEKKAKLGKEMKEVIQEYMAKTQELESNIEQLEDSYEKLQSKYNKDISMITEENKSLKIKNEMLNEELNKSKDEDLTKLKKIKEKKNIIKNLLFEKDSEMSTLKNELEYTKKMLEGKAANYLGLSTELRNLEEKNNNLKAELLNKEEQMHILDKTLVIYK